MPRKKTNAAPSKLRQEDRRLPVKLTAGEYRERAEQLGMKMQEFGELTLEAKASAATFKEKKTTLESELARLSGIIRGGAEERTVSVSLYYDAASNMVSEFRDDTEEVLTRRRPTIEERQLVLPGMEPIPDSNQDGEGEESGDDDDTD